MKARSDAKNEVTRLASTALVEQSLVPVSVLILTKNESNNLPGCLQSVAWSDDIHVLDSYSDDETVEIAERFGAKVSFRKFDSFAQHQNWALENLPFKHEWVFYLDADERVTEKLADTVREAVKNPGDVVAFNIRRRDFFMNRWLKHVQATPFYLRLFRPHAMRYERLGHCISKPQGPVGRIDGYLDHFPFSKGMADWYSRHNFYSTQEAEQFEQDQGEQERFSLKEMVFGRTFQIRRRQMKKLFYRLPCRPAAKFTWLYIFRGGFLDGRAGFTYAALMAAYEHMISLKIRERKHGV